MKKAKQVMAIIGVILLLCMYGSTLVFALLQRPGWFSWCIASILCTIGVPVLLYAMELFYRLLNKKDEKDKK